MLQLRPWTSLDGANLGWLNAKHHFAVGPDGNPQHTALGALVVWNDDEIAPGTGFPFHGHRDMEIVTYVREGLLEHQDTLGSRGQITAGNVQAFSAGSGIRHAEYNAGESPLKLFQIWLRPNQSGIEPRWATKPFPKSDRGGRLVPLASGFADDLEALPIQANARVLGALLLAGQSVSYAISPTRHAYLVATTGSLDVNGMALSARDGIAITGEQEIRILALEDAELVLVDAG
nr:pirin family protein [uncultured Cupriavidus sp.]